MENVSKKLKGGIEGYHCPKKYFDYHEVLWLRKRENILKIRLEETSTLPW